MPPKERLRNKILLRLPEAEHDYVIAQMERVELTLGDVVAEPGTPPKWIHFPESGILSSMVLLEDGSTVEGSTVGNDGMDGLYLLARKLANPYKINVQV